MRTTGVEDILHIHSISSSRVTSANNFFAIATKWQRDLSSGGRTYKPSIAVN